MPTSTPSPTTEPPEPRICPCGQPAQVSWDAEWGDWHRPWTCAVCLELARQERHQERVTAALDAAGIPPRWRGLSLSRILRRGEAGLEPWEGFRARLDAAPEGTLGITLWNAAAVRGLRDWRPEAPSTRDATVTLTGPVGGGKTALAVATLADALRRAPEVSGAFLPEPALVEILRQEFAGTRRRSILTYAASVGILVLDELGAPEKVPDWHRDAIEYVIGTRYNAGLATLITSNLPLDRPEKDKPSIGLVYGDRVLSRMVESMGGTRRGLPGHREILGVDWRTDQPHPGGESR